MRTLFMLCGLPFAGKSTLARCIASAGGALVISLDEILLSHGLAPEELSQAGPWEWRAAHEEALARLAGAAATGVDIVVDDTNCFRFLRDNYRRVAGTYGYRSVVAVVDVSREELDRRMRANAGAPDRHPVDEAALEALVRDFEWPAEDELQIAAGALPGVAAGADEEFRGA